MIPTAFEINAKNFNKRYSLDLIRFTPGGISRAEIARKMGLTRSAVTPIVTDLLATGLVREAADGPATGGRRATLLEINPNRGRVVGIDMGVTHVGVLVSDLSAIIIEEIEIPFDIKKPPRHCLNQIDELLRETLIKSNTSLEEVLSVGIGVPGPLVAESGTVVTPPIMPGWDNYPIRSQLENAWGRPVILDNDAALGALGEWSQGAGRGERNLAYIKVGTGVGAGLLLDGNIYRGHTGGAGEIGHITLRENGPKCACGNYGCLEALAGGQAIARRAQAAVKAGPRTQLETIVPVESITARDVAAAARLGDLVAQKILSEAGSYLGIAIANLINLFNPGMVVVGGGVAQIGDLLLDPIRQAVRERCLRSSAQSVRINSALLGRRSTSLGAVVRAIDIALDRLVNQDVRDFRTR